MARFALYLLFGLLLAASVSAGNRIIGGTPITIDRVPFAAAFTITNQQGATWFFTGGVVLTSRHILSAAHSFPNAPNIPIHHVRLGSSFWQTGGVNVLAQTAVNHPDYNFPDSDISVVILSQAVPIGPGTGIGNAILPHPTTTLPTGMPISVAGWGVTEAGSPSAQLLNIDVFVIDFNICRERNGPMVTQNMFCAGILNVAGIDACTGDSGGPAYSNGVVYGVVSWGIGCGSAQNPGVYATVAPFTLWIQATVNST